MVISDPRHRECSNLISQKQDEHNIYVILKTMCPPSYHHNGFVATHALGHMMSLGTSCAQVHELPQSHCGDNREGTPMITSTQKLHTHDYLNSKIKFQTLVWRLMKGLSRN